MSNQPVPFPMDRDGHNFYALFQYVFYTWVQNCTLTESKGKTGKEIHGELADVYGSSICTILCSNSG